MRAVLVLRSGGCSKHTPGRRPFRLAADGRGNRRLGERQVDVERRALALARGDPDASLHATDELAADVEPEAGAPDASPLLRVDAVELAEDPLLLGSRDADALVPNGDTHAVCE